MVANQTAWDHWSRMNQSDRPQSNGFGGIPTIPSQTIRDYCRDFDLSWLDYEKIRAIDLEFRDAMVEKQKSQDRIQEGKKKLENLKIKPMNRPKKNKK